MHRRMRTAAAAILLALLTLPAAAAADATSHRKAVEDLLAELKMEEVVQTSILRMVDMQTKQNPAFANAREPLIKFYQDTIGWAKIKDDMIRIWTESFSEPELNDLLAFYRTPTGRKALQMIPTLMQKGSQLGQQKIQARMPELQKLLQEEAAKSGQGQLPVFPDQSNQSKAPGK